MNIEEFCRLECELQQDNSQESINQMIFAYNWAVKNLTSVITVSDILTLGSMVKPDKNFYGFRVTPVIFSSLRRGIDHNRIDHAISRLLAFQDTIPPEIFYREFEEIHPFNDGNGRVGAILYNYMSGSLNNPTFPPNFW